MKKEKNRFTLVVEYLRAHGRIKNQKDMANQMGTTESTISRNKHGNVQHADEETLDKINHTFGDIINIGFLRGESDIIARAELPQISTPANSTAPTPPHTDQSSLINAVIAAKDDAILALKREQKAKDETIATLRDRLTDKDNLLAAKDDMIHTLQQQLRELRGRYDIKKDVWDGLHPLGVAEETKHQNTTSPLQT